MPGFYRTDPTSGELLSTEKGLHTPSGIYMVVDQAKYTYPIDGAWRYFATEKEALSFFALDTSPKVVAAQQARAALVLLDPVLMEAVEKAVQLADQATRNAWAASDATPVSPSSALRSPAPPLQ